MFQVTKLRTAVAASFAAIVGAAAVAPAEAAVIINYPSFTACNSGGLTCVGDTAIAGGALRLTPAASSQSGAGYSTAAVALGAGATFSTTFQFQITQSGGINPADGLTFVVAAASAGLGGAGGGLGYLGVPNSVAVEFDTYDNGEVGGSNHVGVDTNGALSNNGISPYGVAPCDLASGYLKPGCMSNGNVWTVNIDYDGTTNLLDVYVQDGSAAVQHIISGLSINLGATLGTTNAFVGFTSGTGGGWANHDILNWSLANDRSLGNPNVPEPGSLLLVGAGLLGAALTRRQRAR